MNWNTINEKHRQFKQIIAEQRNPYPIPKITLLFFFFPRFSRRNYKEPIQSRVVRRSNKTNPFQLMPWNVMSIEWFDFYGVLLNYLFIYKELASMNLIIQFMCINLAKEPNKCTFASLWQCLQSNISLQQGAMILHLLR